MDSRRAAMTGPDFAGEEQPVEDVLDQRRDDAPAELDDRGTVPPPAEADEADYAEQQLAVPPDDGYHGG
jgi:hypothetical protein